MYHLTLPQNFLKVNKSWQLKSCGRNQIDPHEIIQTSLLGGLQKNSLEHNDCLYVAPVSQWRIRIPPTGNNIIPQNYFQRNCRIVTTMLLESIGTTLGQYVF